MKDGIKIHPRQTRQFFKNGDDDKRITVRPTIEQMQKYNIDHYKGKQFKYLLFTCNKRIKKKLISECKEPLTKNYPKQKDLKWKKQKFLDNKKSKWVFNEKPPYLTDMDKNAAYRKESLVLDQRQNICCGAVRRYKKDQDSRNVR